MRYSQDLKERVLNFIREGGSKAEASRRYKVSLGCIFQWLKQPIGYEAKKPGPKSSRKFSRAALQEAIKSKPDSLLKELAKNFNVSINAISNALRRMNIVRKKKAFRYTQSLNHEEKRRRYLKRWYKAKQNQEPLVYLDESGFDSSTERLYAWAEPGKKIFDYHDGSRRKRTSLLGGYRNKKLIAPFLFDGTCNTVVFNTWLEKELLPILSPGTLIILDNAAFHKSQSTRDIVEKAGCHLLFLPPYSPHLNPIEKLWANLKQAWRNNADITLDELIKSSKYLCD